MLHITNGDSAAELIRAAGLSGTVVAWRDVLHEGPVPAGLSLDELRAVRARFLADRGWAPLERVTDELAERDAALARFREHAEVVLWFEHDLYDQLQLLQILDWFAGEDRSDGTVTLICLDSFPGIEPFQGLGQLSPEQMGSLFSSRRAVTQAQLELARAAWSAFRSSDPTAIERLLAGDTSDLPFLRGAITRHLEEFPAVQNGLSRTERRVLEAMAVGVETPGALFRAVVAREERPFMGDITFWDRLAALSAGSSPLLRTVDGGDLRVPGAGEDPISFASLSLRLTESGRAVLAGRADWVALNGVDRWLGGVHLHGPEAAWRWDDPWGEGRLVALVPAGR